MPITGRYITDSDAEDRLSAHVWRRICDDNADGVADTNPGTRLIKEAESYVEGFIGTVYSLTTLRAFGTTNAPNEVKRLCLDVLEAYAIRRHPTYIKGDWRAILDCARRDLLDLKEHKTQLDITTAPEPAGNIGGIVESGDVDDPDVVENVFLSPGHMGDF